MTPPRPSAAPGPLGWLIDLFSSVWTGVWLMTTLFLYSSIGSAGIVYPVHPNLLDGDSWVHAQLRQWRPFEMTEFEWFHWWPFDLLIGLICLNLSVVTLRRIKLNALNLGVWMIHAGVIILALGSVIYFTTKVEGDVPVVRREVSVTLPDGHSESMPAVPGTAMSVGHGADRWDFRVWSTDPEWVLATGDDAGQQAYSVTVMVGRPDGERFMRQLIDGHPDYTEDLVFTQGTGQPFARAVKELGTKLVDDELQVSLALPEATQFYLAHWVQKSWALYLRERGELDWVQRSVEGLPLYNDYVRSAEDVWVDPGETVPVDPIDVVVASDDPRDPLAEVPLRLTGYLRHAVQETRRLAGGRNLDPFADIVLDDGMGERFPYQLVAFDPARATAEGFVGLVWAGSEADRQVAGTVQEPLLIFDVPGSDETLRHPVRRVSVNDPELEWVRLGESDYEFRVEFVNEVPLSESVTVTLASVEVRTPERSFRRWVFEDPTRTMDVSLSREKEGQDDEGHDHDGDGVLDHGPGAHGPQRDLVPEEVYDLDPGLAVRFQPGRRPSQVTLVAGPGPEQLGVVLNLGEPGDGELNELAVGEPFSLGRGATLTVERFAAASRTERRPAIVPRHRRDRNVRHQRSMVQVQFGYAGETHSAWVGYHDYPIRDGTESLRRYWLDPTVVTLGDGREVELVLSRQRLPLPNPVRLDDFVVTSHVGGFQGTTQSILNWTSQVSFLDQERWSAPVDVSVNNPAEHQGLSFFQAQWDPPSGPRFEGDVGSSGLNYTVLGVGNRHGVGIQLLGCTISVLGMLYAFYVKPILRRRRSAAASARPAMKVPAPGAPAVPGGAA